MEWQFYWVDLNDSSPQYGRIYWTSTFPSSPGYAFNSLKAMFETLAEAYEKGIFYLDNDGYLQTNYKELNDCSE
jgi:hypothetical protein